MMTHHLIHLAIHLVHGFEDVLLTIRTGLGTASLLPGQLQLWLLF